MNGERRMRLSEKFMDAPGTAKPDCLIAARIANTLKAMYETDGNTEMAKRFVDLTGDRGGCVQRWIPRGWTTRCPPY